MSREAVSGMMMILLILNIFMLAFGIRPVKTEPGKTTVPDDYTTIQQAINAAEEGDTIFVRNKSYYENVLVNKTVTLIGENREATIINGGRGGNVLHVVADNVTFSNFTITGSGSATKDCGIYVNSSNNVFSSNIVTESNWGIYFDGARNNTLASNVISNNLVGQYMERSDNNTLRSNILANNNIGFYSIFSDYNVFDENMIVENEGSGFLVSCGEFCTFKRNMVINNLVAFWLDPVCGSFIMNNSIANNRDVGVRFHGYSYDNVIIGNNITGNKEGLFFHDTSDTTILHNSISKNEKGIAMYGGSSINIRLEIKYNSIINNTIGLWHSEYLQPECAKVSRNNFIDNNVQAKNEKQSILQWNAEYPYGGNYWSDYVERYPNAEEIDGSGIWDTPYVIDENNQDNYPLIHPYVKAPLLGDLDGNGVVNIVDINIVARAFGSEEGDPNWNETADINRDGVVNIQDIYNVARDYGKTG